MIVRQVDHWNTIKYNCISFCNIVQYIIYIFDYTWLNFSGFKHDSLLPPLYSLCYKSSSMIPRLRITLIWICGNYQMYMRCYSAFYTCFLLNFLEDSKDLCLFDIYYRLLQQHLYLCQVSCINDCAIN